MTWYVLDLVVFAKSLARDKTADALRLLGQLRGHCWELMSAVETQSDDQAMGRARLLPTYRTADMTAMGSAAVGLTSMYRELAPRAAELFRLAYPEAALQVAEAKLTRATWASGGDGGESNSPSKTFSRRPATSVSDGLLSTRQASIGTVLSGPSTSPFGLCDQIRSLTDRASPLNDASTTGGETAASTLTLPP